MHGCGDASSSVIGGWRVAPTRCRLRSVWPTTLGAHGLRLWRRRGLLLRRAFLLGCRLLFVGLLSSRCRPPLFSTVPALPALSLTCFLFPLLPLGSSCELRSDADGLRALSFLRLVALQLCLQLLHACLPGVCAASGW